MINILKKNRIMARKHGVKSLISVKTVGSNVPAVLFFDNGDIVTNPFDIANTSNNYFASLAATTKKA